MLGDKGPSRVGGKRGDDLSPVNSNNYCYCFSCCLLLVVLLSDYCYYITGRQYSVEPGLPWVQILTSLLTMCVTLGTELYPLEFISPSVSQG